MVIEVGMHVPAKARAASGIARFVRALWLTTLAIVALGIAREAFLATFGAGTPLKDLRHISLDGELNIATWYSSSLMLGAAGMTLVAARLEQEVRQRPSWLAIAAVMLLMSIDETASFHESFITIFEDWAQLSDFLHFSWVILGIPFVILFAAFSIPFLLRLERTTAILFVIAGGIFVCGALVMEMIDGAIQVRFGAESLAYRAGAALEDTLELTGMTLFVTVLASYLGARREAALASMNRA